MRVCMLFRYMMIDGATFMGHPMAGKTMGFAWDIPGGVRMVYTTPAECVMDH